MTNLKEFAGNNFKFDKNCIKFTKWVENTVVTGEIAHHEQFLLFLQCFQRLVLQIHKNQGLFGKGLLKLSDFLWFLYQNNRNSCTHHDLPATLLKAKYV